MYVYMNLYMCMYMYVYIYIYIYSNIWPQNRTSAKKGDGRNLEEFTRRKIRKQRMQKQNSNSPHITLVIGLD